MHWLISVFILSIVAVAPMVQAQTNDDKMQTLTSALSVRAPSLIDDASTEDIAKAAEYLKAIGHLLNADNPKETKASINKAMNYLVNIDDSQLLLETKKMRSTKRELKVLQMAIIEVGSPSISLAIDDYKTGGKAVKRALLKAKENLTPARLSARTKADKARLDKAITMLSDHVKKDIPNKIMAEILAPFTDGGRVESVLSGKQISAILMISHDPEWAKSVITGKE